MSRVTLNFDLSKFLLCIFSQGQDLYSHQKLNVYIYWFSFKSGYRRRRRQRRTPQYNHQGDISPMNGQQDRLTDDVKLSCPVKLTEVVLYDACVVPDVQLIDVI